MPIEGSQSSKGSPGDESCPAPDEDIALLTGHSISKKVPVLHEADFHKKPELARKKQIDLLSRYAPPVELPIYKRGQFARQPSDPSKFDP